MGYHWVAARRRTPANAIVRYRSMSRVRLAVSVNRVHGVGNDEEVGGVPDSSDGPTVLRILLGTQLRRLREARGITARQAAAAIRASESKISRMELGRNAIREIDVLDLLTLYGVDPGDREQLLTLAEKANQSGWWHRYHDILPEWFKAYI